MFCVVTAVSLASPASRANDSNGAQYVGSHSIAGVPYMEWVHGGADLSTPLPVVVALHSLGAGPRVAVRPFNAGFPCGVRLIAPRGPKARPPGFAWFDSYANDPNPGRFARLLGGAKKRLVRFLRGLPKRYKVRGKPVLAGFSQGGHLAYAVAFANPGVIDAAFPVSGTLPRSGLSVHESAVPIHAQHGVKDQTVPVVGAKAVLAFAKKHGLPVTLHLDRNRGHRFTPASRQRHFRAVSNFVCGSRGRSETPTDT